MLESPPSSPKYTMVYDMGTILPRLRFPREGGILEIIKHMFGYYLPPWLAYCAAPYTPIASPTTEPAYAVRLSTKLDAISLLTVSRSKNQLSRSNTNPMAISLRKIRRGGTVMVAVAPSPSPVWTHRRASRPPGVRPRVRNLSGS